MKNSSAGSVSARRGGPCDDAVSVGIKVETDFEIKRPKYDCKKGFWFCTETHTYLECKDASGNVIYQEELCFSENRNPAPHSIKIDLFNVDEDSVIMSFPKEYFRGHSRNDIEVFSVDDERLILPGRVLVMGDYQVYEHNDAYVVEVPTKPGR